MSSVFKMSSTTSSSFLSSKEKRYDRQLRLWGDHGQSALEAAHVCLINGTAVGAEILKNLVLPGIGSFTILDPHTVTAEDLSSNFFVTVDRLDSSRGECVAHTLCELNTEVRSNVCMETIDSILDNHPHFFADFTIVIATGLSETQLTRLSCDLWSRDIPLIVARTCGMIGYVRLAVRCHHVIESHPDNAHEDLRIDTPFPSLVDHMNTYDLTSLDDTAHGNVPYLVILYKYLEIWRQTHDGNPPRNYREKKEFKELVRNGIRTNKEGVPLDEENFDEAINNVNSALVPTAVPSQVRDILNDQCTQSLDSGSVNFWVLARALSEFITNEGKGSLPVRGRIPDMTSSSDYYIELQRVYQRKASEDIQVVSEYVNQLLSSLGKPDHSIDEQEVKLFCRHAAFLRVIRTTSITDEYTRPKALDVQLSMEDNDFIYYTLLRASDVFYSRYKMYPGNTDMPMESDITQVKAIVASLLLEWGLSDCVIEEDYIHEYCRYGGAELHSVAAYIGGVASQEVIKIITKQYVPINNTYMYNAATSTSSTAEM